MDAMPNSPRVRHHRYHRVLSALKRWKSWANSTEESFTSSKGPCPKNTEITLEVETQIPSENPSLTQDPFMRVVCSMFHLSDITLPCFKPESWTLTCMTNDWTPTCNRPPGVSFSRMSSKTCFLQDPYSQLCTWVQSPGPHQLSKHSTSIFWIWNVPCPTTEALGFAQKLSLWRPPNILILPSSPRQPLTLNAWLQLDPQINPPANTWSFPS